MINAGRHLSFRSGMLVGLGMLFCLRLLPAASPYDESAYPVAPFRITERNGELGTDFLYKSETEKNDGSSVKLSNRSFEEYILYRLRGYAYTHPRLLDIDAQVKLGLLQQALENSGLNEDRRDGSQRHNTFLSAYHLYLSFFKEHPLSFSIHADRDRDAVMDLFTDRIMTETEDLGAALHWKKGSLPDGPGRRTVAFPRVGLRQQLRVADENTGLHAAQRGGQLDELPASL